VQTFSPCHPLYTPAKTQLLLALDPILIQQQQQQQAAAQLAQNLFPTTLLF
jgi:hypothetical protein